MGERSADRAAIADLVHGLPDLIAYGAVDARLAALAATGADFVSAGALTHSSPAIDISFEIEPA